MSREARSASGPQRDSIATHDKGICEHVVVATAEPHAALPHIMSSKTLTVREHETPVA
jgi:hypothetical protein